MKTILIFAALFLSACSTTRAVWEIKDRPQFDADYKACTSEAVAFRRGDSFRDQCMVLRGYNINLTD